ncbi:MAG: FtsW/RodA/SpoVE family cell cycle protein [Phycisphaerales bacterium]
MLRPGQVVVLCALALLTLGVVMVSSAGMEVQTLGSVEEGPRPGITPRSILFSRSSAYFALSLAAIVICSGVPVGRLAAALERRGPTAPRASIDGLMPTAIGVVALLALLATVYLPGIGHEVNYSHRWLRFRIPGLGAQTFQPSEIAKWGLLGLLAWYAARRGAYIKRFLLGFVPGVAALGIVSGFVAVEDLGTGVLIAAAGGLLLLAAGARFWHFALFIPAGVAGVVFLILTSEYRVKRLLAFLDPYADAQTTGYQMIQSMAAIAEGGGAGRGLGNGLYKFGYLPEDTNDFLFAIICEELGIAGAAVVVSLLLLLLWSGSKIVARETSPVLRLFGVGVLATIGIQSMINLIVVTGLGPTKGIALPLVSSGGTGWILTAACLGLLASMDHHHAIADAAGSDELEPADEDAESGVALA